LIGRERIYDVKDILPPLPPPPPSPKEVKDKIVDIIATPIDAITGAIETVVDGGLSTIRKIKNDIRSFFYRL